MGGIIAGQLGLGYLADRIGRKWGSVVTAATMLAGGVLLACSNGPTVHAMFVVSYARWSHLSLPAHERLTECEFAIAHHRTPRKCREHSTTPSRGPLRLWSVMCLLC